MIVIADSTPLNYLILIHQVDLLPQLFDRILIPPAVFEELQHQETPDVVRRWIASPPSWLQRGGKISYGHTAVCGRPPVRDAQRVERLGGWLNDRVGD